MPLPIPMTEEAAAVVRENLAALRTVIPTVGVENSVFYFQLGDPFEDGAFLRRIVGDDSHLILDLHNVYTLAVNTGVDIRAYLETVPFDRVIEIHVSGGVDSAAEWLPDRRIMRLDSHDDEVPEPVWALLEHVGRRCPALRGITLERMEGSVTAQDVDPIRRELERARRIAQGWT